MDFFQCTLKRHSIGGIMEKVQILLFSSFLFELVKVIWQTTLGSFLSRNDVFISIYLDYVGIILGVFLG